MKKIILASLFILTFGCNQEKSKHVVDDTHTPRVLYVLNAKSGTFEDQKLKLEDIHSVLYFSDRPNRLAGHIELKKFAKQWKEDKNNPPNAALSILDQKDEDIVFEVSDPQVENETITFTVTLLKGKIPEKFKNSALFIDLDSLSNQYFALEDTHALDCTCGD